MSDATAFSDSRQRKARGSQGKKAEDQVKDYFKSLEHLSGFDWERNPDARAAGGRFQVRTGDFYAYYKPAGQVFGRCVNIEVKETKIASRLPAGNFSRDSIARCYKRSLAGVLTLILIHHSTTGRWVVVPISVFFNNVAPSWPTESYPSYNSAKEALDTHLAVLFK